MGDLLALDLVPAGFDDCAVFVAELGGDGVGVELDGGEVRLGFVGSGH